MKSRQLRQRLLLDVALFAFVALLLAEMGPYRTLEAPQLLRTTYWLLAVFFAGTTGVLTERVLARRVRGFWIRIAVASMVATLPVTLYIYALNAWLLDLPRRWWLMPQLAWQ